jgi:hypothetical protein
MGKDGKKRGLRAGRGLDPVKGQLKDLFWGFQICTPGILFFLFSKKTL